jgi:hypothetical protein
MHWIGRRKNGGRHKSVFKNGHISEMEEPEGEKIKEAKVRAMYSPRFSRGHSPCHILPRLV